MERRTFGNTNLTTSVIGFGGWPMGKGQYGDVDDSEAIAAVHTAMDLGITLFDTAANYGWGYGEKVLGKALKGKRDKVLLVSKGGMRWDPTRGGFDRDCSEKFLRLCLEESLERLQTDYVDIYLTHWPETDRPSWVEEAMETFIKLQSEGKVRYGGISNCNAQEMSACMKHFPIITNQVGYHLFDRRIEKDVIPLAGRNQIGVMAYGSLAHGLLTGTMSLDTKFGDDDWRKPGYAFGLPLFKGEFFERNLRIVDRLREFAQNHSWSLTQLAAGWVLSNSNVTVALTGAKNPEEITQNVLASECKLTNKHLAEIDSILASEPPMPDAPLGQNMGRK